MVEMVLAMLDPVLAQALAGLVTAVSSAILLWSAHRWGPGSKEHREDEHEHHDEWAAEDDDRRRSRASGDAERQYRREHVRDDEPDPFGSDDGR